MKYYLVQCYSTPSYLNLMKKFVLFSIITLSLSSCVSRQDYAELESVKNYYAKEAEIADSLKYAQEAAVAKINQLEGRLKQTTRELEATVVANDNLLKNFRDLNEEYSKLVEQNRSELRTSSYEKLSLQDQLIAQQAELDNRQNRLNQLEKELYEKEMRLNQISGGYDQMESNLADRNRRIQELESRLAIQKQEMARLRAGLNDVFRGISSTDLEISEKEGRLYVSLSQNLLFKKGSTSIDNKGLEAIRSLAAILNRYPDVEINVEGHTDTDGTSDRNWDLSVSRATSVVKALTKAGLDPRRVTASGRAFYQPVAPNDTENNKAKNRRTAIILSPAWGKVMDLLNQP